MRHIQNGLKSERERIVKTRQGEVVILKEFQGRNFPGSEGKENALSRTWKGIGASPGLAEGWVKVLCNPEDPSEIGKETILVCPTASRELVPILSRVSGLVTERGGILAIASGWARELDVPAVVGVGNLLESVKDGDRIRINGLEGTVELVTL